MTKTFAERCHIAQQSLPDAQYKAMLTALHAEMLAKLAEQPAPVQYAEGLSYIFREAHRIYVRENNITWLEAIEEALAEQPAQQAVAYGMWDTMLGKDNRMMMVRLDKGQDGCTVPLYTAPQAPKENT